MRGRKKSVEKDTPSSPTSLRSAPNQSARTTTRIPRAQRSVSPQPSTTRSVSSPSPLESLGTHSFVPTTRSQLSPSRGSSKSPTRSVSPSAPTAKSSKSRGSSAHVSPPRTTSRAIPRTPSSTSKSVGAKTVKERATVRSMPEENKNEDPNKGQEEVEDTQVVENANALDHAAEMYIMSLLVLCSHIKYLLAQYRCNECISVCQLLPRRHFSSGWVQQMIGRAYFELNDYKVSLASLSFPFYDCW